MPIRWTKEAADDLERLFLYIEKQSPAARIHVADRIRHAVHDIGLFPQAARIDRETGTHEAVVRGLPLLIIYSAEDDFVEILAVFHTARDPRAKRF
jgi:toxin ParE1/3/4